MEKRELIPHMLLQEVCKWFLLLGFPNSLEHMTSNLFHCLLKKNHNSKFA